MMTAMLEDLRATWREAPSYQRLLVLASAALIGAGLGHGFVWLAQGAPSLTGPVTWRKPIEFGVSLGLSGVFLGWVMRWLPHRPRLGWTLAVVYAVPAWLEWGLITLQKYRGVASHFNDSTGFDTAVFSGMGLMVMLLSLSAAGVLVWTLVEFRGSPSLALGWRSGLAMLVVGLGIGFWIIQNGNEVVDTSVLSSYNQASIFGTAGSLKIAHAAALHAPQVVPVLAWLAGFAAMSERRRTQLVAIGAGGYAAIVLATIVQAQAGQSVLDPTALGLLLAVLGVPAVAGAYLVTLRALVARRTRSTTRSTA
jgi:hypothetical protein